MKKQKNWFKPAQDRQPVAARSRRVVAVVQILKAISGPPNGMRPKKSLYQIQKLLFGEDSDGFECFGFLQFGACIFAHHEVLKVFGHG